MLTMDGLKVFEIRGHHGGRTKLGIGRSRNDISITFPFVLNEKVAKLVGMMPDGSLSRDLSRIEFTQKKDISKIDEFRNLLKELFGIKQIRVLIDKTESLTLSVGSKPLAVFMHYLGVPKSDEPYRIPSWIMESPTTVVKAYVSEVFAMEGSVCDPTTGKREVRLHSCDFSFMTDMRNLLEKRLGIKSSIFTYHIKDYGNKYYLRIGKREDLLKLRDVGIALVTHQRRLESVCNSYKPGAWKISLIAASRLAPRFTCEDLAALLKMSRWATSWRIRKLRVRRLVVRNPPRPTYSLTKLGWKLVCQLSSTVKIQPIRTNSRENEGKVKAALKAGLKTKHDIVRFAGVTHTTVREVLMRMGSEKLK